MTDNAGRDEYGPAAPVDQTVAANPRRRVRIALFGDSIAQGLGVRELRYAQLIASELGAELVDLSETGFTVHETLARIEDDVPSVDVALVAHGVTEPIKRPSPTYLRFMPTRWRRRGWMDPRPYYSTRRRRRVVERLESGLRWRMKVFLLALPGSARSLVGLDSYVAGVTELVSTLEQHGVAVVVVGPPGISERYFPGSATEQKKYRQALMTNGIPVVDVASELSEWDDYFLDRFHPNERGHAKIAATLLPAVQKALNPGPVDGDPTSAASG